ncbi:hypothetical protein VK792_18085 [Mesobacterium sp. TK19101]|uniref:Uncharacterized protein n=1 Tax=Mesobacterium hydrothermale TaxID=3111907 RepID=A0ABU6HLL7_9RHOB|nr:hypothetical protein [Mesobacterium sp. TK19101]MEC3863206.1 hypothetical protein [Mesobacterium sp. TK19101]
MTRWPDLDEDRKLALRAAYSADPTCLTGTCSLEAKTAHFTAWLAERGVDFRAEDLYGKPRP